jgi:hypothetical protein
MEGGTTLVAYPNHYGSKAIEIVRSGIRKLSLAERSFRVDRLVAAILPHRCFTVNSFIFPWRAGKARMGIMSLESAKSFCGAFRQSAYLFSDIRLIGL